DKCGCIKVFFFLLFISSGSKNDQKDRVKQDITHLKHHLNAVPFTDEWVAAIETFGEVKRKAQDIGPFDCTKHSTNLSSPSHSS
ncbi:hypothetical protein BHE74_00004188, partial [Ensete ventricosum]